MKPPPTDLQLYDSYRRRLCEFKPLRAGEVGIYACGPTVYDYAHIGNLRTYIFEDILRRTLEYRGNQVRHVINITDVGHLTSDADTGEDKMEAGARRRGISAWEIAERYTRAFQQDLQKLNILAPTIWCRATDHIAEQLADIVEIERRGFTYLTSDGVYFDTSKLENYGHLARLDRDGLEAGARVDIGDKRHATDFALWKFSPTDRSRQMEWDSPWGRGFPGWHIECSAMAVKYLGTKFDIHCGGKDHIPVHHCNEIAQSQVCHGTTLANFWLHGYFLESDIKSDTVHDATTEATSPSTKMSKSDGEFLRLKTLMGRGYEPLSYRYLCLTAHYRSDLKFTWASLDSAVIAFERLRSMAHSWGEPGQPDAASVADFSREIYRDLNTARALAVVWRMVKSDLSPDVKKATMLHFDQVLGLGIGDWQPPDLAIPDHVVALVQQRAEARKKRDWAEADRLRTAIAQQGFELDDSASDSAIRRRRG